MSVPVGVTLASLGNAEDTFIVGAASETVGETSGAVRCVILHTRSAIRGFTLTGGYTDNTSANGANGAGVVDSAGNGKAYAYDCVISNNVSVGRGGGANAVTCIRCRLSDNSAAEAIGAGIHGGMLINCIVGPQKGNCSRTYGTKIRNCTFLPARRASEQQDAVNYSTSVSADDCRNSLFLCLTRAEARYTNCIIATNAVDIISKGRTYNPAVLGGTVTLIRQEDAFVKKSGVTQARSPAVDAGDNALYDMSWGDVDIRGARRIVNGTIDIGAVAEVNKMYMAAAVAACVMAAGCRSTGGCGDDCRGEWVDVFDATLSNAENGGAGWHYEADGCLAPTNAERILSARSYGPNFDLDCTYRLDAAGNSGLYIYD